MTTHITRSPHVMHNTRCLAHTRIPTEAIAELVNAGLTTTQITIQYPTLTTEQIVAAWRHENTPRRRLGRRVREVRLRVGCWFLGINEVEGL